MKEDKPGKNIDNFPVKWHNNYKDFKITPILHFIPIFVIIMFIGPFLPSPYGRSNLFWAFYPVLLFLIAALFTHLDLGVINGIENFVVFDNGITPDEPTKTVLKRDKRTFVHFNHIKNFFFSYHWNYITLITELNSGERFHTRVTENIYLNAVLEEYHKYLGKKRYDYYKRPRDIIKRASKIEGQLIGFAVFLAFLMLFFFFYSITLIHIFTLQFLCSLG
jgi:hypothetical protein